MDIKEIKKILREKFNCEFIGMITCNEQKYIKAENINKNIEYYEFSNEGIMRIEKLDIIEYLKDIYEPNIGNIIY